jgi:divinyl protochlorophyllide a 8-vinyl-reductase
MTALADGVPRIGPNAVIRTVEAVRERDGAGVAAGVLRSAGLERYASDAPAGMVPERDVVALFTTMRERLGRIEANASGRLAGERTAEYLLEHRIPRPVRVLLRLLPAPLAGPIVLRSILDHTWTFAGSATVGAIGGRPTTITIAGCPICRGARDEAPACGYYAATFERLFRRLVSRRATVTEVACEAMGAGRCAFEVRY